MNTSKMSKRFNRFAIVIVVLGVLSLGLEVMIQKKVIENALTQGAANKAIIDYLWQQVLPEVLKIMIMVLGFLGVLKGLESLVERKEDIVEIDEEIEDEEFSDFDFVDVISEEESELT